MHLRELLDSELFLFALSAVATSLSDACCCVHEPSHHMSSILRVLLHLTPYSASIVLSSFCFQRRVVSFPERVGILQSTPTLLLPRPLGITEFHWVGTLCDLQCTKTALTCTTCHSVSALLAPPPSSNYLPSLLSRPTGSSRVPLSSGRNLSLIKFIFVNLFPGPRIMNVQLRLRLSAFPSSSSPPESHLASYSCQTIFFLFGQLHLT